MATADNAGTEIHYEVTGEGTPVVLLHGFPDSGRLWRHQVPALTGAGYRVIVPDMRGYGRSARPVEVDAYDILHLVSDVRAVLADAGVPRAHVVGHDWGAAAAWVLASVAPDTVDRLVALSIGHPATFRGRPGQLDLDQLEKAWFMLLFQFPGVAEEWLSANQWTNFRTLFRHPDEDDVIADLEANSSLTPGLNYFRAIVNPESFVGPPPSLPPVQAANAGRLEQRRLRADRGPDDPLGGACGRPVALCASRRTGPLDAAGGTGPGQRPSPGLPHPGSSPGPGSQGQAIDPPPARAGPVGPAPGLPCSPTRHGDRRSVTRLASSNWRNGGSRRASRSSWPWSPAPGSSPSSLRRHAAPWQ